MAAQRCRRFLIRLLVLPLVAVADCGAIFDCTRPFQPGSGST